MATGSVEIKELNIDLSRDILLVLDDIGRGVAAELKETSPVRRARVSGKYAKGWDYDVNLRDESVTIYNKGKHRSLTHLLEHGHLTPAGNMTRAIPHIMTAYGKYKPIYLEKLKKIKIGGR